MESLISLLEEYGERHRDSFNKFTHFIGVPLIIFAIQIFFSLFNLYSIAWSYWFLLILFIYYFILDKQLACLTGLVLLLITYGSSMITQNQSTILSLVISILLFILGWIFQLIGHIHEKKSPAFLSNIMQLFIAPLFLVAECCLLFGYRQDLKKHS